MRDNLTIVELPEFIRKADRLLSTEEHDELLYFLSTNPTAGVLVQGTGGIRKLRWATGNRGKSGSTRVIYFYHNPAFPLFLLTAFGKNEQENLTKSERNDLAKLTKLLTQNYTGTNR
ncbi:MAG: type II toxin-antitoxin system RelE/ParE family toxin [Chlorobiaceae bacterium]|nr:type II toxin-antitoxin system RelE/ParE family toxin [Chlorobiaceae bacterium]